MKSLVCGFLSLLVFVEVVMCCEGCLQQEREALTALYSKIGNPMYLETDCCLWAGYECNTTTGRVSKIQLFLYIDTSYLRVKPNFTGPWQLNFSDFLIFKDLKTLDLTGSYISNCIRTDDQGLKNLEVLRGLDAMCIVSGLDGLSSLKSLYLPQGEIPFQVLETLSSKLLHLEVLDMTINNLTNTNLSSLKALTSLKELYLASTGLDSDPHIQGLKNLEILDISDNYFSDIDIGSALSGLSSLKSLNLGSTQLTMRSIHNISKLRSLEILDLSGNYNLNGSLDNISKLSSLEILDLSENNFNDTDIGSALSGLSSLKSLNLRSCQITMRSIHNISKLRSLEILHISGNNFNDIDIGSALSGLSSLKSLNLADTGITPRSIHNISKLRSLEILDLSRNYNLNGSLDISGLLTLSGLKFLDFSSNGIVDFIVHTGSNNLSRLDILALDRNNINGSNLQESLRAFSSIKTLTLGQNYFTGKILAEGFRGLSNLENLTMDESYNLENVFFQSIGDLPSLKVLSVTSCGLNGTLPIGDWYKLKKLEKLDLSFNDFGGQLPSSFVNMTSLQTLAVTNNHFIGNIGHNLASFTSLEYLNFEGNQFEFPVSFAQFSNNSNLKFIYGNGNKVILDSHSSLKTWVPKFQLQVLQLSSTTQANSIPLPNFLRYQYHLTYVDFTGCKLRGEFPNWLLENNTKLETLNLRNCSFIGDFRLPPLPHFYMGSIDISNNLISCQMLSDISSIFPNLVHLNMSRNAIHGSIPNKLSHLSFLVALDLSDNQLIGEIPVNFFGYGSQGSFLTYLLLDGNSLSGNIPSSLFNLPYIECLDISNNNFFGKIPSQIKNNPSFVELSMSNNHFEGSIPSELAAQSITYLDLSQNNFSGCVPSFANSSAQFIHLNDNNLSCLSKNMFGENYLMVLDLSNNNLIHGIHDLIDGILYLSILLLKGNHFTGNIPKQLCNLTSLNILDLSFNNFFGNIPSCLGKMPFENTDKSRPGLPFDGISGSRGYTYDRFGKEKEKFTSKKRLETYTTSILIYMTGIDISHNELNGSIPFELGNLTRIQALNLSNNFLTGSIPITFSNLVQVESLDLSFNMLRGQIPPRLSELTSLEVFSVAHNNLSGATPERKGQFITFDESSYEGNQFLCGPPLPKSCNPSGQAPASLPNGLNIDGDDDSWVDMYVFRLSFGVAYTMILLVIATVLYINPYWRRAWFYYIGLVGINCYYFIEDTMCKFF